MKFGAPEMLYEPYAGDMMRQAGKMDFEYAYGFSCVTQDNALHMEYQYYSEDTGYAKSKTSRDDMVKYIYAFTGNRAVHFMESGTAPLRFDNSDTTLRQDGDNLLLYCGYTV